jgi:hypothetical protein
MESLFLGVIVIRIREKWEGVRGRRIEGVAAPVDSQQK